ncbi:MAG: class I SAM-dependent methyltransferase [Burkholderiaceae bacterium]
MTPEDLKHTANRTLSHYESSAEAFWQGTKDHDVSQNIDALLAHLDGQAPFDILDFGCGPGRDLQTFKALGHRPIGLEGATALAVMARHNSGCEVWEQNFLALDLPSDRFDGIFANAVLFHVPSAALPRVLAQLCASLKPHGVLFCSNPHGNDQEGWQGSRYGAYHSLATWRQFMQAAGFVELTHYYRPTGLPLAQQPWLASVWRRAGTLAI